MSKEDYMFTDAKNKFAKYGVDVEKALSEIKEYALSVHCWQGDDVLGF